MFDALISQFAEDGPDIGDLHERGHLVVEPGGHPFGFDHRSQGGFEALAIGDMEGLAAAFHHLLVLGGQHKRGARVVAIEEPG